MSLFVFLTTQAGGPRDRTRGVTGCHESFGQIRHMAENVISYRHEVVMQCCTGGVKRHRPCRFRHSTHPALKMWRLPLPWLA